MMMEEERSTSGKTNDPNDIRHLSSVVSGGKELLAQNSTQCLATADLTRHEHPMRRLSIPNGQLVASILGEQNKPHTETEATFRSYQRSVRPRGRAAGPTLRGCTCVYNQEGE